MHATGTILSGGTPVTSLTNLYVRAFDGVGVDPDYTATVTTTPGADGAYSVVFLVLAAAPPCGARHAAACSSTIGCTGVVPGDRADGINPVVFDDDYVPPVLHVSGTLLVDGNPVVTATTFDIVWNQRFEPSGVHSDSRMVDRYTACGWRRTASRPSAVAGRRCEGERSHRAEPVGPPGRGDRPGAARREHGALRRDLCADRDHTVGHDVLPRAHR